MITLTPEPDAQLLPEARVSATVPSLRDEQLDALPYGVICLDAEGTVLRYNLAEARLARLDRSSVLGKNFFRTVAPCTANQDFEGKVRQFRDGGAPSSTFDFVFDFKFGAQVVEVELVRPPEAGHVYLCVNRRRFLPMRTGVEARQPAPLQADLAPGEKALGVLRDDGARRRVLVSPIFFESMRQTWDRVAPRGWPVFCASWGLKWGRLAVVDLEVEALEATGKSLRELPMRAVVEQIASYVQRQGWGRLAADFSGAKTGVVTLTLERSALAEAVGQGGQVSCHVFAGFFRALFCHLANKLLAVQEVRCGSQGHASCAFVVVSQARRLELEAACAQGGEDVGAVLRAFAAAPRSA